MKHDVTRLSVVVFHLEHNTNEVSSLTLKGQAAEISVCMILTLCRLTLLIAKRSQDVNTMALTKYLVGLQAVARIILIPVSIVTTGLSILSLLETSKFQHTHGQATSQGYGVPRYRTIVKDRKGLLQLQTSCLMSSIVAIFSFTSTCFLGHLHLDPRTRRGLVVGLRTVHYSAANGIKLMIASDSLNTTINLMSWVCSTVLWPSTTCATSLSSSHLRRGLLLGCKLSAAELVSMFIQWILFLIALISTVALSLHLMRRERMGRHVALLNHVSMLGEKDAPERETKRGDQNQDRAHLQG